MRSIVTLAWAVTFTALACTTVSASILGVTGSGVQVIQDENRESVFDVDGDGALSVGDVLIGFSRLDTVVTPPIANLAPTAEFVLFATQVGSITRLDGITPRLPGEDALVDFVPVSGAGAALGLDLASLTSASLTPVTDPRALAANFSGLVTDKTIASSAVPGSIVSILDLITEMSVEGTLSTVAGLANPDDFWQSFFTSGTAAASPVGNLPGLALVDLGAAFSNPVLGSNGFFAGLSVLSGDSGLFLPTISIAGSPNPAGLFQIGIINGEISGAANADFGGGVNPFFGTIPGLPTTMHDPGPPINFYGAASNADVTFDSAIPEPTSLLVLGAIAFLGSVTYRKSERR